MDRAHLGETPEHLDEVAALELLARRSHEHHERLAGVPALADDEMAEVAGVLGLVVGDEVLLARPVADGVPDRVAEVGRQPALLDLEHLVPAAGLVKPEHGAVGRLGERVLHLVAIEERRVGRENRLERRLRDAADPLQRVANLVLLRRGLEGVVQILETAAAADGVVSARSLDAVGRRLEDIGCERLRKPALHLRHPGPDPVARQPSADEDDEPVQPGDAVPAVGERVDLELDLLVHLHRRGHRMRVATGRGG